jgi:hypothetical protein
MSDRYDNMTIEELAREAAARVVQAADRGESIWFPATDLVKIGQHAAGLSRRLEVDQAVIKAAKALHRDFIQLVQMDGEPCLICGRTHPDPHESDCTALALRLALDALEGVE